MRLANGRRVPLRCSIVHLDESLFSELEHGDELVFYIEDKSHDATDIRFQAARALYERTGLFQYLEAHKLNLEPIERTGTHMVWVLVYDRAQAPKNEAAAEE